MINADKYVDSLSKRPINEYIANVSGLLENVIVGGKGMPFFCPSPDSLAYVTNPGIHYFDYAAHVLRVSGVKSAGWQSHAIELLKRSLAFSKPKNIVYANNYLLSTNPSLNISTQDAKEIVDFSSVNYPGHALLVRSISSSPLTSKQTWDSLNESGFKYIFNRKVFYADYRTPPSKLPKSLREDINLIGKGPVEYIEDAPLGMIDFDTIANLYNSLYIDKHYQHNLKLSADWFRVAAETKQCKVNLFLLDKKIVGFSTLSHQGDSIIAGYAGYQPDLKDQHKLYRRAIGAIFDYAIRNKCLLHLSSGVGDFKKRRGCVVGSEYDAVYTEDCNFFDKYRWNILLSLYSNFAEAYAEDLNY